MFATGKAGAITEKGERLAAGLRLVWSEWLGEGVRGQLARESMGNLILRVVATGLALALSIALARILGPGSYGVYAYVMAVVILLSIPSQLGLPTLLIRETAVYQAGTQWGRLRGLLLRANQGVLVASLALGVLTATIGWVFRESLTEQSFSTLFWGLVLLPLLALGALRAAVLRGLGRIVLGMLPEEVIRAALFLIFLLAVVLLFGSEALTPSRAMSFHVVAAAAAFGTGSWLLVKYLPTEVRGAAPSFDTDRWRGSALPFLLLGGVNIVNSRADILMLGLFKAASDVGVYRAVLASAALVPFVFGAVNRVLEPHVARLHAEGKQDSLQRLVTLTVRIAFVLGLPVALAFVLFGGEILGFVFGSQFARGHLALAILTVGQTIGVAMGSVVLLLNMTGNERSTVRGVAAAAALNILLNGILIPVWGLEGAAVATAFTLTAWNVVLVQSVKRQLGIRTTVFAS